jgi:hypothetical protein
VDKVGSGALRSVTRLQFTGPGLWGHGCSKCGLLTSVLALAGLLPSNATLLDSV